MVGNNPWAVGPHALKAGPRPWKQTEAAVQVEAGNDVTSVERVPRHAANRQCVQRGVGNTQLTRWATA
jgi:hypothetical protein